MKVNLIEITEVLKIELNKKFLRVLDSKDYISAHIQKKFIDDNFDWIETFVKDGALIGKGNLKPRGCENIYEIILKYDPNSKGRKEVIFILNNNSIKYGITPHLYADNSLCLYYPKDLPVFKKLNFIDIIPWLSKWIVTYELWMKYGIWLDKEVKH